jgi:2-dehydro-3-deoxyphosphogalactonate aldolase
LPKAKEFQEITIEESSVNQTINDWLNPVPLLAILRGITPQEVNEVGNILIELGYRILEVPLNSPDPYQSIQQLAKRYTGAALIGAGTVLQPEQVLRVANAGGTLVVSPNLNPEVVKATKRMGMISVPGVFTPTEAFQALDAGADALKIFPGDVISPSYCKALRAVLPRGTLLVVTGGVNADNLPDFLAVANGAGIGSALYSPGKAFKQIRADAQKFVYALPAGIVQ